jgi:hypothetical protein
MKKEDKKEKLNASVPMVVRNERGQLTKGSINNPNGRPRGSLGKRYLHYRDKFDETLMSNGNLQMVFDNYFELCRQMDFRALHGIMKYIVPSLMDNNEGASKDSIHMSTAEVKQMMLNAIWNAEQAKPIETVYEEKEKEENNDGNEFSSE